MKYYLVETNSNYSENKALSNGVLENCITLQEFELWIIM